MWFLLIGCHVVYDVTVQNTTEPPWALCANWHRFIYHSFAYSGVPVSINIAKWIHIKNVVRIGQSWCQWNSVMIRARWTHFCRNFLFGVATRARISPMAPYSGLFQSDILPFHDCFSCANLPFQHSIFHPWTWFLFLPPPPKDPRTHSFAQCSTLDCWKP